MSDEKEENKMHSEGIVHVWVFSAASVLVIFCLSGVYRSEYALTMAKVTTLHLLHTIK